MTATWPSMSSADSNTQDQQLSVLFMSITYHLGQIVGGDQKTQHSSKAIFNNEDAAPSDGLGASPTARLPR